MTAEALVEYITWIVYFAIFVIVVRQALRDPRESNINIAFFFGVPALIIVENVLAALGQFYPTALSGAVNGALFLSLSYLLLRLVADFSSVPPLLMRATEVALVLLSAGLFVWDDPRPWWFTALVVLFFSGLQAYGAYAFVVASRRSSGVTRRRMRAVAFGSLFLGLLILVVTLSVLGTLQPVLRQTFALLSALCYFVGFAPPRFLRRAWQEPELRAFLGRAAQLPRLPSTEAIIAELERGAAASVGTPGASIGLYVEDGNLLRFRTHDGEVLDFRVDMDLPAGRVYLTQQPLFIADMAREAPAYADVSRAYGSTAMLIAPVTAGENRLGVLTVYAARAPIFVADDLDLVVLLADQAAVILESRALIDEAARVRAREETARLKDDFLSAAAHDLKTPLTTLITRAQLLERRATRNPDRPADLQSIKTIVHEGERLRNLVLELLDASRAERGQLVGQRQDVDLVALARESAARQFSPHHNVIVSRGEPIVGCYDGNRIGQLLDNLVENAIKYSPHGGEVRLDLWRENGAAHISVSDQGIGIPPSELPHIFDRFYRARNVNEREFMGMGLGLFICRAIAEQHGGSIAASNRDAQGATFHVTLPITACTESAPD